MSHKPVQKLPSLTLQYNTDIRRYVGINYGTVSTSVNERPSGAGRSAEVKVRTRAPFSMEKAHGSGDFPSRFLLGLPRGESQPKPPLLSSLEGGETL